MDAAATAGSTGTARIFPVLCRIASPAEAGTGSGRPGDTDSSSSMLSSAVSKSIVSVSWSP